MEEIEQLIHDESFLNYCFRKNKEDIQYWENWLSEHPEHAANIIELKRRLLLVNRTAREKVKQQHFSELQDRIAASAERNKSNQYKWWRRASVAASIVLLFSVGGYFMFHKRQQPQLALQKEITQDVHPGGNKAILTLGNGQQVVLTDASNGTTIAQQGNTAINKTADGQIAYSNSNNFQNVAAKQLMNTITTPRGGQWFVILSDGTKVWLNAASSISYPVVFSGKERKVSITGEAYFEVVHNAAKPFRVQVGDMQVEDIGTAFNINAYTDEPSIKTTLVSGSAKILENKDARVLIPGQQAIVKSNTNVIQIVKVNTDDVIGWKNGQLYFENEDLKTIMRQVSRWYDVNIVYQGAIPGRTFIGGISRKSNISELIKILDYEDVHCTLNGKTITVRS